MTRPQPHQSSIISYPQSACPSSAQTSPSIDDEYLSQGSKSARPAPTDHVLAEANGPTQRLHGEPEMGTHSDAQDHPIVDLRNTWKEWRDRIFVCPRVKFHFPWMTQSKATPKVVSCTRRSLLDFENADFSFEFTKGKDKGWKKLTIGEVAEDHDLRKVVIEMFPMAVGELERLKKESKTS
ncbi:hypothetical protein TESG_06848 [Trichophyton tonsurans CBS 112818]|uniref:Uncharacterized protein n=1 Tax=Trichophyton tonsurans (strain CBS 112818) TaxID=647933 RepID=F2S7N4_TRIT1|nr:hypothetical protein TESG_06848 [Trichophyton tonsurans CBS 112818]